MAKAKKGKADVENKEQQLVSFWSHAFKMAMVEKAPYTKQWNTYMDAYNGDYFKAKSNPEYKSDYVANYIFSIIETIRPIMLDNDPKFQAMPRQPDGTQFSSDLNEILLYEWDREKMNTKLYRELITTLIYGTSIFFTPWDSQEKQVKAIPVSPFNIYPDPLATSVEDAEYIIYASYKNDARLKRLFPAHKEKLTGSNINYDELVHDNGQNSNVSNQILVLEIWTRDYETYNFDENGEPTTQKYPNGRVITVAPELGILLSDKANPYNDKIFPFALLKDYDVPGKFWGEGEVAQLLSPQKHMNDLNNAVLDNAKSAANMPWIVDKNSGIKHGSITNRPGLIVRKNPGSEVRRDQPPSMPGYIVNAVSEYKSDMEQISGIFDSLKGNSATGVYTAQGILALQEAGQARIRLKVKLMEEFLGDVAKMWYSRMQQYWKEDKWITIARVDGSYDFKRVLKENMKHDYDIRISAGSTMPVNRGAMLDLMIRLAQTQMPDGQMLVDREAVVEYLPTEVKSAMLQRMEEGQDPIEQQLQDMQEQIGEQFEQIGQQLEEVSGQVQETAQGLEQLSQESKENDDQTFEVIDGLVDAIEKINDDIVQIKADIDMEAEDEAEQAKMDKLKEDAYNSGYSDAGSMEDVDPDELDPMGVLEDGKMESDPEGLGDSLGDGVPDDVLGGIEGMDDAELSALIQANPDLSYLLE